MFISSLMHLRKCNVITSKADLRETAELSLPDLWPFWVFCVYFQQHWSLCEVFWYDDIHGVHHELWGLIHIVDVHGQGGGGFAGVLHTLPQRLCVTGINLEVKGGTGLEVQRLWMQKANCLQRLDQTGGHCFVFLFTVSHWYVNF